MTGDVIKALMAKPIAFHRAFVDLGVGITGAVMLSQAFYWSQKTADGWFFKGQVDWTRETGLTRYEQEGARHALRAIGVLHEQRKGHPARLFFRVDFDRLAELLMAGTDGKKVPKTPVCAISADCQNVEIQHAENQQSSVRKSSNLDCGKPADRNAEIPQSIYKEKITTKNTSKTTSKNSVALPRPDGGQVAGEDANALQAACRTTWQAYSDAHQRRYGTKPVRNAKVNANVRQLVQRLGAAEAPQVAAFFVDCVNDAFVVRACHGIGLLLAQAEGYRTQWASGQAMTATRARQIDQTQSNADVAAEAIAMLRAKRAGQAAKAEFVDVEARPC